VTAARILLSALLVAVVCTAAGQVLLHRLKLRLHRDEHLFLAFLTGSACVSTLMFLLAALRRVYPGVLWALAAGVLIARAVLVRGISYEPAPPSPARRWRIAFWAVYILFGVYYLANAMAPDTSADGTVYHLGLVARYFDRHGFFPLRTNIFANMPAGVEMLFLFARGLSRQSAGVVHLLFLLAMPFGMMAYARRMGQPLAGIAGALLFYVTPVVGKDGSIAYNDVATAAIVFGCFYAIQVWHWDSQPGAFVPAGLLAGFAFACKYTAVIALVYAGGFVLAWSLRRRERPWPALAAIVLPASLMMLPWIIKNVVYVGNPVHPLLSRVFPNRYYAERLEQDLEAFLAHPDGITYAQVPWEATTGGRLDGVLGPVFLLSPLALLSLRSAMGRHLLAAFAVTMCTYPGNLGARFLIPPLPFLALALAAALAARPGALAAVLGAHVILSWPAIMPIWAPAPQWRLDAFEWRAALRLTPEEQYLTGRMPDYRAGLMLDRWVPRGQLVYAPSMGQLAYHRTETIGSNLFFHTLETLAAGYRPGGDMILRRSYTFAPLRTRTLRLVLNGRTDMPWRIREVRFFHGPAEWPRDLAWRLAASSNPWEIGLAFDNSQASAWESAKKAATGQWLEVDFGAPLELTAVAVEQPADQWELAQAVEVMVDGRFQRIAAQVTAQETAFGPGWRRASAAEIRARGVAWLLLRPGDYGEEDLRLRAPYWGAREVAREGEFHLWKLE
jgi:hypothetical protein